MTRSATPADADHIALHRYPENVNAAERPVYATWVAGAIERGSYVGFLILDGDEVIAGVGLTVLEWGPSRGSPMPWRGRIVNVWTHPEYRRRGHARTVVNACLDAARRRGVTHVGLGSSDMARGLYGSLGFRESGAEMWLAHDAVVSRGR